MQVEAVFAHNGSFNSVQKLPLNLYQFYLYLLPFFLYSKNLLKRLKSRVYYKSDKNTHIWERMILRSLSAGYGVSVWNQSSKIHVFFRLFKSRSIGMCLHSTDNFTLFWFNTTESTWRSYECARMSKIP